MNRHASHRLRAFYTNLQLICTNFFCLLARLSAIISYNKLTIRHGEKAGEWLMRIHKSAEDYLEAVLMIQEKKRCVRAIDIATLLGVSKPSVSFAVKNLREDGYILVDDNNLLTLSDKGMAIANRIYTRHKILTAFFIRLGVNEEIARADACKVEHDISEETFTAIRKYARSIEQQP